MFILFFLCSELIFCIYKRLSLDVILCKLIYEFWDIKRRVSRIQFFLAHFFFLQKKNNSFNYLSCFWRNVISYSIPTLSTCTGRVPEVAGMKRRWFRVTFWKITALTILHFCFYCYHRFLFSLYFFYFFEHFHFYFRYFVGTNFRTAIIN